MPHHDPTEYPENPCQTGECVWADKEWAWVGSTRRELWCDECAQWALRQQRNETMRLKEYWLCVDGLTFEQFRRGEVCDVCCIGAAHLQAAQDADDGGSCPAFDLKELAEDV